MSSLVEGLDDHIEQELARVREELRLAIAESGYTLEQIAMFAGVSFTALRNMLHGRATSNADTLIRIAFVVGARIELKGGENRSFQVVPLATGSRRSSASSRTRGAADSAATGKAQSTDSVAEQRKKRAPRKRTTLRKCDLAA